MTQPDRHDIEHGGPAPDAGASRWAGAAQWLQRTIDDLALAAVLDVGPHHVCIDDSYDVHCAQVQRLDDGLYLLRLSTMLMIIPLLDGYSAAQADRDSWYHDDRFEDCTHGYLFSASSSMIADLVVAWFRDRGGFENPDDLGYATTAPKRLPRTRRGRP